jgi:hypothetical protein
MTRARLFVLLCAVVAALTVFILWPSDESRIRNLIKKTAEAAERNDMDAVMEAVDFNYRDNYGLSYLYLRQALERQFAGLEDIQVEHEGLDIEAGEGGRATASMDVRVIATAGGMRGYYMGDMDNPLWLSIKLEKNAARKWRVVEAEYRFQGRAEPF